MKKLSLQAANEADAPDRIGESFKRFCECHGNLLSSSMYSRSLSALAFAADFPPVAPEFHQRTHRVRLRNLGTTDKKSSHKIKHRKIPRVHCILQVVFFAFYCIVS